MLILPSDAYFLLDLDGTLIDSLPAVERAWSFWAAGIGLNAAEVLPKIHGRRSIDSIRALAPHLDAEEQDQVLRRLESTDTEGVTILPGSIELLQQIPPSRWTIVTSGTSDVAKARLRAVGINIPETAVYGEDVQHGKPAPDPYLLGAARLGAPAGDCIVFEDTEAGVSAGLAARMRVVKIGTPSPQTDWCVTDLSEVQLS